LRSTLFESERFPRKQSHRRKSEKPHCTYAGAGGAARDCAVRFAGRNYSTATLSHLLDFVRHSYDKTKWEKVTDERSRLAGAKVRTNRTHLRAVACRMLGSLGEAEGAGRSGVGHRCFSRRRRSSGPRTASNDLYHRMMLALIGITVLILFLKKRMFIKDAVLLMVKRQTRTASTTFIPTDRERTVRHLITWL
jgi:hypothetical protein